MNQRPQAIFFGTPEFAVPALEAIHDLVDFQYVVTQPDAEAHRGLQLVASPVKERAEQLGLAVLTPSKLNDPSFIDRLHSAQADVFVLVAYGKIIPESVLSLSPRGTVNLHPSLLPHYRGPSPIAGALLHGDAVTGVSLMLLDEEVDHGPIIDQAQLNIDPAEHRPALEQRLAKLGAEILRDKLVAYVLGQIVPRPQDHSLATFTKLLHREDGLLNWQEDATVISRMIRAYDPWPGTFTTYSSKQLKILSGQVVPAGRETVAPGKVLEQNKDAVVLCGRDALRLDRVQFAGSKIVTGQEFIRGHHGLIGTVLG